MSEGRREMFRKNVRMKERKDLEKCWNKGENGLYKMLEGNEQVTRSKERTHKR